jgi:hypothetical protein
MAPLHPIMIGVTLALVAITATTPPPKSVTAPLALLPTQARDVATSCAVTKPAGHPFVPPAPYSAKLDPQSFWFGTEKLWTVLHADGVWNGLPHYTPDDPTFRQKLFFWRAGFNAHAEPRPALIITGKRLDAPALPLASDRASNGWQDPDQPFMVTAINLPTLGCWRITAQYRGQRLTFVVRVTQ